MSERKVSIDFFFDGKPYAARYWAYVPRQGEEIMLNHEGEKAPFRIARVVWGAEGPLEHGIGVQAVNIEVSLIKDTTND